MTYQLTLLESATAAPYSELTYPRLQKFLTQLNDEASGWVAIGAHDQDQPIGLVMAQTFTTNDEQKIATVYSLFVVPEQRQQGIGTALVQTIEIQLAAAGCDKLSLEYLDSPSAPACQQILHKQSWSEPEKVGFIAHAPDVRKAIPLFERVFKRPLPANHEVVRWQDLTKSEIEDLRQSLVDDPVGSFDPFVEESTIEPANSVVLRNADRIIGWMMTHRLAPDIIRYTTLYIRPEGKPLSQGLTLMIQALKYQAEETTASRVIYNCDPKKTPAMAQWTERRFVNQGWLDPLRYRYNAEKSLAPARIQKSSHEKTLDRNLLLSA